MKRARTEACGGNEYELRNNKVQKKNGIMPAWFIEGLGSHDVWHIVEDYHRKLHWSRNWFRGTLQIFRCEFDNGDVLFSEWNIGGPTMRLFNSWWGFLSKAKEMKRALGWWSQMTIMSSNYWMIASKKIHKWESFHIGRGDGAEFFEITEGHESSDETMIQQEYINGELIFI